MTFVTATATTASNVVTVAAARRGDLVISCVDEERYKLFDEIHYDNSLSLSLPKSAAGYLAAVFILVPKPTTQLRTLC